MNWLTTSSLILALGMSACSSAPSAQAVRGTAALTSFPSTPTEVQVHRAGVVVASAAIDADGSFEVAVPPGTGYRIALVNADRAVALVYPRAQGNIELSFDVRSGANAFDLGSVRYTNDLNTRTFAFSLTGEPDGECEDGIDAETGAVCVDDDEGPDACDDDAETDDDGVDCVDGIDSATGDECDGGPAANAPGDDGEVDDNAETDDDVPGEGAIADHNLPYVFGCDSEEDDD